MKRSPLAAALCACTLLAAAAFAQDKPKEGGAPGAADMAMEAMVQAATPGPNHKLLDRLVGDFTFTNKIWMAPGAPPVEWSGTAHAEWVLGGRYVQSTIKGTFMGQSFEGRGTDGYDNVTKTFFSTWIDNLGTGIITGTGSCDAAGKACTYNLEGPDPMSGGTAKTKNVTTYLDNGYKMEMFMVGPDGSEMKTMEMVATKKK